MVTLWLFVLLFVAAKDIKALLSNQRIGVRIRNSRCLLKVFDGQVNYDPFESDARLRAMVLSELLVIKRMNSTSIKTELTALGFQSGGFVDKSELEKILARQRVKGSIRTVQENEQKIRSQETRADLIEKEISRIQASRMTELSITKELHSLRVKFDVSEDLVSQLALARLGIPTRADLKDKMRLKAADTEEAKAISDTMTDLKGVYNRFIQNVEAIIPDAAANISSFENQQIISEKFKTAQEYLRNIGLTKLEQQAQTMTSGSEPGYDSRNKTAPVKFKAVVLSEAQIIEAIATAGSFESFDDIMRWAANRSRSELAQLLVYRNEDVPEYAPRSSLAAILADSLLIDRRNRGIGDFGGENDFGRNFVTVEDETSFGGLPDITPANSRGDPAAAAAAAVAAAAGRRPPSAGERVVRKKRYNRSKEMSSFFFERELFTKFTNLFSGTIRNIISEENLSGIRSGAAGTQFTSFLSRTITLGCKAIMTAAYWAGGDAISASHVTFTAAAYSILLRKGIWSFLSVFLVIRIIRELAFVRDTFSDLPTGISSST